MASKPPPVERVERDRSFERLYRGHRDDVYRFALWRLRDGHEAEDVTQATFANAYRALLRGTEPAAPRAWLIAIADNVCRRSFARRSRVREEPLDADLPAAGGPEGGAGEIGAAEIGAALAQLPGSQRQAFALRELGGLSYEEISAATGTTVASVQMSLFRARRALRSLLEAPAVVRRRGPLALPFPTWLPQLVGRGETLALPSRAAVAAGALALAVVGSTLGPEDAGGRQPPREERQPLAVAAPAAAAPVQTPPLSAPAARPAAAEPAGAGAARTRRAAPARPAAAPVAAAPRPAAPTPAAETAPVAVARKGQPKVAGRDEVERAAAPLLEPLAEAADAVMPSLPPLALPVPELPLPAVPAPELSLPAELEGGAAGVPNATPPLPPSPLDPPALPPLP